MAKSKIYTRAGDRGETSLISGKKVPKNHPRTTAYGTVDELNSCLGAATSFIQDKKIEKILQNIQNELFNIGAQLADPRKSKKIHLENSKITVLESIIDKYDAALPRLNTFIVPGGAKSAALLLLARTVCRRAEREVVSLSRKEKVNPNVVAYLNRLGDLLFVLARYLNKKASVLELPWEKD